MEVDRLNGKIQGLLAYISKGIENGLLCKSGTLEQTFSSVLCIAEFDQELSSLQSTLTTARVRLFHSSWRLHAEKNIKAIKISIFILAILTSVVILTVKKIESGVSEPSIINYSPESFEINLSQSYFYKRGNSLQYSSNLASNNIVLFSGAILDVAVAPNNELAAVFTHNELWLISADGKTKRLIGSSRGLLDKSTWDKVVFYRNDLAQWSSDSKQLYLLKDGLDQSNRLQSFPENGKFIRYNIESEAQEVLKYPFRTTRIFIRENSSSIYYSVVDKAVDEYRLFKFDSNNPEIDPILVSRVEIEELNKTSECDVYADLYGLVYRTSILDSRGLKLIRDESDVGVWSVLFGDREYLRIREGIGFKGNWHGIHLVRSNLMNDEPFLVLGVSSNEYSGAILVDLDSGKYRAIGGDFLFFENTTTCNTSGWDLDESGIKFW